MGMKLKNQTLGQATKTVSFKFPLAAKILADNLYTFMKKEGGIGLAANQVGLRDRVFVMEVDGIRYNVFNPVIAKASDETEVAEEGCLSFPDRTATVERYKEIEVQYTAETGVLTSTTLTGLTARCFQHEYDHLHGITMLHREAMQQKAKEKATDPQESE